MIPDPKDINDVTIKLGDCIVYSTGGTSPRLVLGVVGAFKEGPNPYYYSNQEKTIKKLSVHRIQENKERFRVRNPTEIYFNGIDPSKKVCVERYERVMVIPRPDWLTDALKEWRRIECKQLNPYLLPSTEP